MNDISWFNQILNRNPKKYESELNWHKKAYAKRSGKPSNFWYEKHFTKLFKLDKSFYNDKRLLDIGCGPLGSLEWADNAKTRIGLDPLANEYMNIGASKLKMTFVLSSGEKIPFPDSYFDVVSSFNSIDHVDDLEKVVSEIKRVCKPGGTFLLITDLHEKETVNEPQCISWDFPKRFADVFVIDLCFELEKCVPTNMYLSVEREVPFDHVNSNPRYGILKCKMTKNL
jgi:SAM-dependent methyltransferase